MNQLKEKVLGYLNMGMHPTVVSFPDDGLFYLFDKLLQGKTTSNSYDPVYTFVHVTLSSLAEITSQTIENEIEKSLKHDAHPGETILDTYLNGVDTVCVLDDVAFLDTIPQAIQAADSLIKKYRGNLHFVYIVEDPFILLSQAKLIPATSSFHDAILFQKIGEYNTTEDLEIRFKEQYKQSIDSQTLSNNSQQSHNHFGTFKRMYKDAIVGTSTIDQYAELLVEGFDDKVITSFKKLLKQKPLLEDEKVIVDAYSKVGFIENDSIAIPIFKSFIDSYMRITTVNTAEDAQIGTLDLLQFSPSERDILTSLDAVSGIISKEDMGTIIWKNKVKEKYSEWALDQRIARLRKKIMDLGYKIDIQTIYGKGYILSNIQTK